MSPYRFNPLSSHLKLHRFSRAHSLLVPFFSPTVSLASSLLHLPPSHSPKLSTPFLHGSTPLSLFSKPSSSITQPTPSPLSFLPPIRAMKTLQGKVVCATNNKTVAVEVVRLAPHLKYKRRVRRKKKFQAHDPDKQFKVGDIVQLEKSRPISKTKTHIAIPVPT